MDASPNLAKALPGGGVIERVIQERIERGTPLAAMYIDLSNFDPYCKVYGWHEGAKMLTMLAQVIRETVEAHGTPDDVVGHISNDRFVVVTLPERAERLAQEIIKRFDGLVLDYYTDTDRQNGYFEMVDRRGNPYRAHVAGVAIAIITNGARHLEHVLQIDELASEVKHYIKSLSGSRYVFDRRRK